MKPKDLMGLGVPIGEPMRCATDFLANYCLKGGDRTRLAEEIEAIVREPARFTDDPLRGGLARALLTAPPSLRTKPAPYRQWGGKVSNMKRCGKWTTPAPCRSAWPAR